MPADAIARRFASGVPDDKAHAIEALEPRLLLSGGQFDPTFGDHGAAHGELFPGGGADAVAIQTDGKIVAGGSTVVGTNTVFALARYQANGSLDRAFGTAGRVTLSFGGNRAAVTGVAVQRDGKIVVAGYTEAWADPFSFPTASRFALARFLPGGAPDRTFGTGGMVTVSFLGFDQADAVALEPDGSIVVAGSAQTANAQTSEFALARLTNRGALDASFGSHGKVLTSFAGSIAATGLLVQRDGKIVASGHMQWGPLLPSGAQNTSVVLARYRPNGSLDPAFADHGTALATDTDGTANGIPPAAPIALQSDGKIVAAVEGPLTFGNDPNSPPEGDLRVFRFTSRGTLDSHFGNGGHIRLHATVNQPQAVLVQRSGRIVIAGTDNIDANFSEFAVTGLTPAGALDGSFGSAGTTAASLASVGDPLASGNAAALRPDGRTVVAGSAAAGTYSDFALAQYTANGRLDDSFGFHGTAQQENGITGTIKAIAVQGDGKIVVAGSELSPADVLDSEQKPTEAALARYNRDGTLDTTFGVDGRMLLRVGDAAQFNGIKIDSAGNIVVAGYGSVAGPGVWQPDTTIGVVARYHPNGTIDRTFGSGGDVLTSFGDPTGQQFNALAIQPNGDIVVGGSTSDSMAVARFLPSGAPDTRFGSSGKELLHPWTGDSGANALALQSDGKIVIAGWIGNDVGLVRLKTNGSLDPTFATRGIVDTPGTWGAAALAIDAQGRITAGGGESLERYLPTGHLDPAFGSRGVIRVPEPSGVPSYDITSLVPDARGGVIVGATDAGYGTIAPNGAIPFLGLHLPVVPIVQRFTSSGQDTSFGDHGTTQLDDGTTPYGVPVALALQPDGKILAADVDLYRLTGP